MPWSNGDLERTNNKPNKHVASGWNLTEATLVGDEPSHRCAIPASKIEELKK